PTPSPRHAFPSTYPATTEIYPLSLHDALPIYFRGNPDLKPERSEGFDIGVEQRFGGGRHAVDVTYFEQDLEDEIVGFGDTAVNQDRKSTRLNSSHVKISYAVFCLKKKKSNHIR